MDSKRGGRFSRKGMRSARLRIVIPYLILGVLWIAFSDRLLLLFRGDADLMLILSTAKGWFYVLITTLLLYVLVSREFARREELERRLMKENTEKEVLLAEIHHRVKNNLQVVSSIVSLELGRVTTEEARTVCTATMARVRSMALVHERLYEERDFSSIDLSEYLRSLAALMGDIYGGPVSYGWDLEPVPASPETAIPFGLFVQEALTNALKYGTSPGGSTCVAMTLHQVATGEIELVVKDEGPGFSGEQPGAGLGMELMKALASQLGGKLRFGSSPGGTVSLCFSPRLPRPVQEGKPGAPGP